MIIFKFFQIVIWSLIANLLFSSLAQASNTSLSYNFIDTHLHYLDFTQRTEGFTKLIAAMDQVNVEKAVIFGMPIVKMWSESDPIRPSYYLDTDSKGYYFSGTDYILADDLMKQPEAVRERFYPCICGINPLDLNAAEQIEILINRYPGFWKGIGEIMSRHDNLTAFTYGESPRANHPALMKVYQVAAKYNLPVLIHHNISSEAKRDPIYLHELEDALAQNPNTKIILAHAGISRRIIIPTLVTELKRMLSTYPNFFLDISWVVYNDYIAKDAHSMEEWKNLITEFPNRFMIGSDQVGKWGDSYKSEITKYYPLLDKLDATTAQKITKDNALDMFAKNIPSNEALLEIEITIINTNMPVGSKQQLVAQGKYANSTVHNITDIVEWVVNDCDNIIIDNVTTKGLITAKGQGKANITAKLGKVSSAVKAITVTDAKLESIAITPASQKIASGLRQQFIATGAYADKSTGDITNRVIWVSSNNSIATIDSNTGILSAVAPGLVKITALLEEITSTTDISIISPPSWATTHIAEITGVVAGGVVAIVAPTAGMLYWKKHKLKKIQPSQGHVLL